MCLYKILLKKNYCRGLVDGVDIGFRIVCQISGQDNVSYKIQKSYWHFQSKKFGFFCFCCFNWSKKLQSKYLFYMGLFL